MWTLERVYTRLCRRIRVCWRQRLLRWQRSRTRGVQDEQRACYRESLCCRLHSWCIRVAGLCLAWLYLQVSGVIREGCGRKNRQILTLVKTVRHFFIGNDDCPQFYICSLSSFSHPWCTSPVMSFYKPIIPISDSKDIFLFSQLFISSSCP